MSAMDTDQPRPEQPGNGQSNGSRQVIPQMKQEPTENAPVILAPPSQWEQLRAQLREKPHYPEGWNRLITFAEESGDIELIKDSYEALLAMYPNTSAAQIAYLTVFLNLNSFVQAESLFKRFLRTSPSVDLFKFYLTYKRRTNTGMNAQTRDIVRKAYEFALNYVGQDKDSGEIWIDYIEFLRSGETNNTWEEQQKIDALRKVYHHAVQIPLENVEILWSQLEAFENNLNKITAKKFMNDLSPSHMQARQVLRKLQQHLRPLFPPPPSTNASGRAYIYLPPIPTFNPAERWQVGAWKSYLRWEERNPLEIEDKDKNVLIGRVHSVYRKAVIRMRFFSEIWYMAYVWTHSVGKTEEALNLLRNGLEAVPASFLLNFAYAETQEINNNFEEVHRIYEKFLSVLRRDLETLEAKTEAEQEKEGTTPGGENATTTTDANGEETKQDKPVQTKEMNEKRKEYGVAWTMYMRFARRAEGFKSMRSVFGKARREKWISWEVYESAALMEYHCNTDPGVAARIFEKGLGIFGDEVQYVCHYLAFLLSINDENNARALFERVIGTFPPDKARPLWERWAGHEYQYGDLAAAQKLEKRMAEIYPGDPPIKRFAQRHTCQNTDAIAARDLGVAIVRQSSTLGRSDTLQTIIPSNSQNSNESTGDRNVRPTSSQATVTGSSGHKRAASPDYKRGRDSDVGPSHGKRARSPSARDRGYRWGEAGSRRRYASPSWDRDRVRDAGPPGSGRRGGMKEPAEEEKHVNLPQVLSWFIGTLPPANKFDGPVFRTDDLTQLFKNAVIPSAGGRSGSPPPPPRASGRPPPDYGPYQGPGGGNRRRY